MNWEHIFEAIKAASWDKYPGKLFDEEGLHCGAFWEGIIGYVEKIQMGEA